MFRIPCIKKIEENKINEVRKIWNEFEQTINKHSKSKIKIIEINE